MRLVDSQKGKRCVRLVLVGVCALLLASNAQALTLTMEVEGEGTTSPSEGSHTKSIFANVTCTAYPAAGWRFSHWRGDLSGTSNPATLNMWWSNKTVKAVFTPDVPAGAVLVSPDGLGYKVDIDAATGKQLVHLEGTAQQMGYQHGYLLAEQVRYHTSDDFYKAIVRSFLGDEDIINEILDNDTAWNAILGAIIASAEVNAIYATADMRTEMQAIADGANARLAEISADPGNITYGRVLLENTAFDQILAVAYPIVTQDYMTDEEREAYLATHPEEGMHTCDGFVALNSATETNSTIMTRSFMINHTVTDDAVIMEYAPYTGNRFVSVTMPGWCGLAVGMNVHGVAIGIDMVPCLNTSPVTVGMGALLTCRYVMQNDATTAEAMDSIKNSVARGVPWIYIVGDKTSGAIAEAAATTGLGWLPGQAQYFAARYTDYVMGTSPDPLIEQIEFRDDLVTCSNHYLDPTVQTSSGSFAIQDSLNRYGLVTTDALAGINGGGISVADAIQLVRYLNPTQTTGTVGGSRTVFDMEAMTLYTRYRLWSDPLVSYTFPY